MSQQIPATSPAVTAGLGLFETMLVVRGRVIQLHEHAARMARSCEELGFPPLDVEQFCNTARDAASAAEEESALRVVRLAITDDEWSLSAAAFPIPDATRRRRELGRAITLDPTFTRALPRHKLTSYASCAIALRTAARRGADEAIFVDEEGALLEGSATNLVATRGSTLITAPAERVLPGIVRSWVLEAAARIGLTVIERAPSIDEVHRGAFLTGSLTTLVPVTHLDGRPCSPPDASAFTALRQEFQDLVRSAVGAEEEERKA